MRHNFSIKRKDNVKGEFDRPNSLVYQEHITHLTKLSIVKSVYFLFGRLLFPGYFLVIFWTLTCLDLDEFGSFLAGFGWFRADSAGFGWFQVSSITIK